MEEIKRIPYGVSSFVEVVEQNQYYVDKTMYCPAGAAAQLSVPHPPPPLRQKHLSGHVAGLLRPCPKGKVRRPLRKPVDSSRPTPLQGAFQVLYMDFSRIGGQGEGLAQNFNDYCSMCVDNFASIYESYYYPGFVREMKEQSGFRNKLNYLDMKAKETGARLYLIIDEYDNFTNVVLNEEGEGVYHAITHASGFYREVFKKFKGMFERIFMIGVSPVTLDDLSSGFNIGWNISTEPIFNMMLGFSETDVRAILQYYKDAGEHNGDVDTMITEMKPWYDNYCFAKASLERDPKMFNCDMVFYYLRNYMNYGTSPEQMIDPNTRTDYNKMKKLIQLDKLDGDRKGVLRRITEEGRLSPTSPPPFPPSKSPRRRYFPACSSTTACSPSPEQTETSWC